MARRTGRVDAAKVRDYLLSAAHPGNGGKAALFEAFGFSQADWTVLRDALVDHLARHRPRSVLVNDHGTKFIAECSLQSPDERNPCVTTVWIVDRGREADGPRLVTCYGGR